MTTTRILPAVMLATLAAAAPVAAQQPGGLPGYSPPGRTTPVVAADAAVPGGLPRYSPPGWSKAPEPAAAQQPATADRLNTMTMPAPPGGADPNPVGTLNTAGSAPLPHGAYISPWFTDGPGCCGPLGGSGYIDYELYTTTGPTIPVGGNRFTARLQTGWQVGMGGRTLFFNRPGDAAWVVDLGLTYQYNRGTLDPVGLFIRQPPAQNQFTGQVVPRPDLFQSTRIRGLHRTAVNVAIGRDWWLWGAGNPGFEQGPNLRWGVDLGGRYGTAHVDLVPNSQENSYSRRQNVFEGVYASAHLDYERPFGGWIWYAGLKVQYGVDWTNIVPPIEGDVQYVNILLTSGIRF